MNTRVDHPPHYGGGENQYEVIKVIEDQGLGFCAGNAVKYLLRAPHKGSMLEDLQKAQWYIYRASQNDEHSPSFNGLINTLRRWFAREQRRDVRAECCFELTEVSKAHWGDLRAYPTLVGICTGQWVVAAVSLDKLIAEVAQ